MQNTLYTNDNLYILNGLNSESVDLIYLDPPFNSKRTYSAPVGSKSAGASFKDMWTWEDVDNGYLDKLIEKYPSLVRFIESIEEIHSKGMMAYITYMTQRLIEMHRVLKNTGSIYLHCDPTASHYLKIVLDEIFGRDNFRNEIVWERSPMKGAKATSGQFGRNIDIILFYSKNSKECYFVQLYKPHDLKSKNNKFRFTDENGRIYSRDTPLGDYSKDSIAEFEKCGKIYTTKNGKKQLIRFLDEVKGLTIGSTWSDIKPINQVSSERTGYPTQKPLQLLHRIIKASSKEGDLVLDPFCGCATTCVAAEQLQRKWIGVDIEKQAAMVLIERLEKDGNIGDSLSFKQKGVDFVHREDVPQRTDIEQEPITTNIKERLFKEQKGCCNACSIELDIWHFEVDHIIPRAKGGGNYYENYQLLCGNCNRIKGDRPMEYLRTKIKSREALMKNKISFGE
jgi:DNA modification methylase